MMPSPAQSAAGSPVVADSLTENPTSFAEWLIAQGKRPGLIGDLAKAAKLDRSFPREGSAEDVRARFSAAGADGDAFAALDDAERLYDRIMS